MTSVYFSIPTCNDEHITRESQGKSQRETAKEERKRNQEEKLGRRKRKRRRKASGNKSVSGQSAFYVVCPISNGFGAKKTAANKSTVFC